MFFFGVVSWITGGRFVDRRGYTLVDGDIVFTLLATGFLCAVGGVLVFALKWIDTGTPPLPLTRVALGLVIVGIIGVPVWNRFDTWTNGGHLGSAVISNDLSEVTAALDDHTFDQEELDLWLGRALNKERTDMAAAIIEAGGDPRHLFAPDPSGTIGHSLLYRTVADRDLATIEFVADLGVDPNVRVATGATALHRLVQDRPTENPSGLGPDELRDEIVAIAELLIDRGADPLLETNVGEDVPCLAQRLGHDDLLVAMNWTCDER